MRVSDIVPQNDAWRVKMADDDPWTDFDSTPYRLQDMVYAEIEKSLASFTKGKAGWVVWPERTFSHRSGIALISPRTSRG